MRRGIGYNITAWVFVLMVLLLGTTQAAETWISKAAGVKDPRKIALTPDGGLMITAPVWNNISQLDPSGKIRGSVSSQHPSALAVSPGGLIYVAVGKYSSNMPPYTTKGEVKVYDANFAYLYSLGIGSGEFVNPVDIEIVADGTVYIADAGKNEIKIFNADGSQKLAFGSYGVGDGFFNKPLAVAIDNATGDIYVADCQLRQDQFGGSGNGDGVRIQVFGKNGNFIKGFGVFGVLFSISDIKFYQGNLYVSDTYLDMIQVYNAATGVMDHAFSNPGTSIRQPSSMAISPDGILYVAGNGSNDVHKFGINDFVLFSATPDTLNFVGIAGMTQPAPKTLFIANTGNGNVAWSLSGDAWISSSARSGALTPGTMDTLSIGVDQGAMPVGQYTGKITVTNQNGTANNVSVGMTIIESPQFALSTDSLLFNADAGSSSMLSQGMNVALNGAVSESYWTARTTASWLGANPVQTNNTSAADVTVAVNTAGLSAGSHTGQIIFESQQPYGVSAAVTVTLSVASSGQISVSTNRADATFSVKDTNNIGFNGSSTAWSQTHVPDGVYTITFGPIAGFVTPKSATLAISGGNSISFEGIYADLRAANNIVVSAAENKGLTTVRIFSPDGQTMLKEFTPFSALKSKLAYNIAVGDIDGDGLNDVLVGLGSSSNYEARVGVYDNNGDPIEGAEFVALDTRGGANVASGDFDGNGTAEIIVAAGTHPQSPAQIRIFTYDTNTASIKDTGIDIVAFASKYGANVAVGDIDGDGLPELIVAPGPDPKAAPEVKVYKIDTTLGIGNWTAVLMDLDILPFAGKCGANIAAGDLDGDGISEIVVGSGSCSSSRNEVKAFYGNGTPFLFSITEKAKGGYEVAVGDIDMDGKAEIVVSKASIKSSDRIITAYAANGDSVLSFTAYQKKSSSGAKIALGEMGY